MHRRDLAQPGRRRLIKENQDALRQKLLNERTDLLNDGPVPDEETLLAPRTSAEGRLLSMDKVDRVGTCLMFEAWARAVVRQARSQQYSRTRSSAGRATAWAQRWQIMRLIYSEA
jgi:hypothetical protein